MKLSTTLRENLASISPTGIGPMDGRDRAYPTASFSRAEPWPARIVLSKYLRGLACNHFVHVAPDPVFSRLDRTDQGMPPMLKMFRGVFVLRRIATTHV